MRNQTVQAPATALGLPALLDLARRRGVPLVELARELDQCRRISDDALNNYERRCTRRVLGEEVKVDIPTRVESVVYPDCEGLRQHVVRVAKRVLRRLSHVDLSLIGHALDRCSGAGASSGQRTDGGAR